MRGTPRLAACDVVGKVGTGQSSQDVVRRLDARPFLQGLLPAGRPGVPSVS